MEITSKFNIKDRVFWMENNKVRSAVVKAIQFPLVQIIDKKPLIGHCVYFVSNNVKSSIVNWNGGGLREPQIFASKKDLLKSL